MSDGAAHYDLISSNYTGKYRDRRLPGRFVTLRIQRMTSVIRLTAALGGGWDRAQLPSFG